MKKCLNVKAVKAVNVGVTPPSLMVCLHNVLIKDLNLVVFLESISNQVMGVLLDFIIWFVEFPIRIQVLGIKYSDEEFVRIWGRSGVISECRITVFNCSVMILDKPFK